MSFIIAIVVGSVLLLLPVSTYNGISYIDALFTSTSAICVTGLTVLDTGKDFTFFGKTVILILIQLGGLGIMTFSVLFLIFLKNKMPWNAKIAIKSTYSEKYFDLKLLIKNIVIATVVIELTGAFLLFVYFYFHDLKFGNAVFVSIFHSVSAFCNAGFSVFSNSLIDFQGNWYINIIIMCLIIAGGIGFTVYLDIRQKSLSLHSKIVLTVSGLLILTGTVAIFFSEYSNAFAGTDFSNKLLVSLFQSVTARTAGFNTIDLNKFKDFSLIVIMLLMFIGASPGSCGGGVKTTTFTVFWLTLFATARGRDYINIFNRTITKEIIFKSFAIMLISITALLLGILALAYFDPTPMNRLDFLSSTFEAFSALGTVGLSIGYTHKLTLGGKIVIIILMYIGRVGPLTLILGLRYRSRKHMIQYAEENVMLG